VNRFPLKEQIIDSVLTGITTAQSNYNSWIAHELYLSYAPAKFLSIHVAQEIAKIRDLPEIFIDASIEDILKSSLAKRDDYRKFMSKNNISQDLISITLDERFEHQNDEDCVSRAIITLRNGVKTAKKEYKQDIDLLCKLLSKQQKQDSTLDYGIFGFYLDISNTSKIKAAKRIEQIINSFDNIVDSHKNLKSNFKGGDIHKIKNIGEWCVGCYIIEPIV